MSSLPSASSLAEWTPFIAATTTKGPSTSAFASAASMPAALSAGVLGSPGNPNAHDVTPRADNSAWTIDHDACPIHPLGSMTAVGNPVGSSVGRAGGAHQTAAVGRLV